MRPRSTARAVSLLLCAAGLSACAESSIGQDCGDAGCALADGGEGSGEVDYPCFGEQIACDAPEHQGPELWYFRNEQGKPGDAYPLLEPTWVRPLAGLGSDFEVSWLAGDGVSGLFFVGHGGTPTSVVLGSFDEEGTVLAQHELPPPAFSDLPGAVRELALDEEVTSGSFLEPQTHAEGVIVPCSWNVPCATDTGRCSALELISFDAETISDPIRFFPEPVPDGASASWARARDGGVWEFRDGALRKYDRSGALVVSQNALKGLSLSRRPGMPAFYLTGPTLAVGSDDSVSLYGLRDSRNTELWRFDPRGNPLYAVEYPDAEPMTLYADTFLGVRMFNTSVWGDLVMRRALPPGLDGGGQVLKRVQYYDMFIRDVTQDGHDSFIILTQSGWDKEPTPTLCEFPGWGHLRACYELDLGEGYSSLAGYGDRVAFMFDSELGAGERNMLARYDLPR